MCVCHLRVCMHLYLCVCVVMDVCDLCMWFLCFPCMYLYGDNYTGFFFFVSVHTYMVSLLGYLCIVCAFVKAHVHVWMVSVWMHRIV